MAMMTEHCMAEHSQTLGERLADFLSSKVSGPGAEKRLATMMKCDPRTARNLLAGYWPGQRHWKVIARLFGRDVLAAVFDPEIDDVLARQLAEIRNMERELHDRKAHYRAVAGSTLNLAETEDR